MVTVWWSAASLIHYSFLNPGETLTSEKYAQQTNEMPRNLQRLQPISVSRKGPVLPHSNAQLHVAQPALQEVRTLPYRLPCSPALSPTDNCFFQHLDKFLQGKCFHNQQENASTTTTRKRFPLVWESHLRGWNEAKFRRWLLTVYGSWISVTTFPASGHPSSLQTGPTIQTDSGHSYCHLP